MVHVQPVNWSVHQPRTHSVNCPFIHSLTHPLIKPPFNHSSTHSSTHSVTHPLTHHSATLQQLSHSITQSAIQSLIFNHSRTNPSTLTHKSIHTHAAPHRINMPPLDRLIIRASEQPIVMSIFQFSNGDTSHKRRMPHEYLLHLAALNPPLSQATLMHSAVTV